MAAEAADLARSYFGNSDRLGVSLKGAQDWLTAADGAVEALIRKRLAERFQGDGFLGEESGGGEAERLWIVDPIDGTAGFARADIMWCVSIGYVERGRPVLGVIHAPMIGEVYAAEAGRGATRNGRPIRCATTQTLSRSTIEIGWSPRRPREAYLGLVADAMAQGASVRRSASGALGVCWAACGRTDGYLELHINSWDVAAGYVVAKEAGCTLNDFFAPGGIENGNPILFSAPPVAGALAQILSIDATSLQRA